MLRLALLLVAALGRIHVAVEFGDEIGHVALQAGDFALGPQRDAAAVGAGRLLRAEHEVVHGVDVFEQFAVGDVAHAAGLPRRVELMREAVRLGVEIMVVGGIR